MKQLATRRKPIIHPTASIGRDVKIGDWSQIGAYARIKGRVRIGRKAWIGEHTTIGGGRSELGTLHVGDFFHMGEHAFINIACDVVIGHEVGLGRMTNIYTHGGYLSTWDGFPHQVGPVIIGDNVWLPKATVLPGVVIGNRVVVAAESLVNKDLPDGCLAGGTPAKLIRKNHYREGHPLTTEEKYKILESIVTSLKEDYKVEEPCSVESGGDTLLIGDTKFYPSVRCISGPVTQATEHAKNLLRREGIRFRFYNKEGEYTEWEKT